MAWRCDRVPIISKENKVSAEVRERIEAFIRGEIQSYTCSVCNKCAKAMTNKILSIEGIAIVDRNATGFVTINLGELTFEIPVEKIKEQGFVKEI